MLDLGGILAVTSLVLQVISATDQVIRLFDKTQAAPEELIQFRTSICRLRNNLRIAEVHLKWVDQSLLNTADLDTIPDILEQAQALLIGLEKQAKAGQNSPLNILRAPRNQEELARHQKRIERCFIEVIIPLSAWLGTLRYC